MLHRLHGSLACFKIFPYSKKHSGLQKTLFQGTWCLCFQQQFSVTWSLYQPVQTAGNYGPGGSNFLRLHTPIKRMHYFQKMIQTDEGQAISLD
jgi:hypothetical protein